MPVLRKATEGRQRIWSSVRQLRRFTLDDLAAVAETPTSTAKGRLKEWAAYGIVRRDNDGWRLARDLGPLPPIRTTAGLIDRNKGVVLSPLPASERRAGKGKKRGGGKPSPVYSRQFVAAPRSRIWMDPSRSARRAAAIGKKDGSQ